MEPERVDSEGDGESVYSESYDAGCKDNGQNLNEETDTEAGVEVGCGQGTGIVANIGFHNSLAKIVMSAAKPTVEDACQRSLWIAAVRGSMVTSVFLHKGQIGHS